MHEGAGMHSLTVSSPKGQPECAQETQAECARGGRRGAERTREQLADVSLALAMEREAWAAEKNHLQGQLEGARSEARHSQASAQSRAEVGTWLPCEAGTWLPCERGCWGEHSYAARGWAR